jgi:hypothetical protein
VIYLPPEGDLSLRMGSDPLNGIGWVIVGGESGPRARLIRAEWVKNIRDQCLGAGVPFFFKQWGGTNRKAAGKLLDGRTWDEFPLNKQRASRRTAGRGLGHAFNQGSLLAPCPPEHVGNGWSGHPIALLDPLRHDMIKRTRHIEACSPGRCLLLEHGWATTPRWVACMICQHFP